ncbi:MAG TPA: outer membrane beta-barrel protein [Thermoanaerobaculia bacterium]|jgi:hypothetical protein|nr:outer membrane beta-barrel protein [Thermoanaerobaculia bacterium]
MKIRVFLIALAVGLAGAASGSAQVRNGTIELNGFAGYLVGGTFGDGAGFTAYPYRYHVDVGDDLNYGGRVGYNFNSLFEAEFEYARTDTNFVRHAVHFDVPNQDFGDFGIQYFMGYLTFNFGHGRGVPYFTMGGGVADLKATFDGVPSFSKTYGTMAFGGGYKYFFNPHFGLRLDARLYSTALGNRTFVCAPGVACTYTSWMSNFVANGGVLIAF